MGAPLPARTGVFTGSPYRPGVPPGVYEAIAPAARQPLVRLDTAAFIGLAERGPVNTPVPLESMPAFRAVFGEAVSGLLLPQAVAAFFANGGRRCIAVRSLDLAGASTAQFALPGLQPAALFAARNPGAWGGRLMLRLQLERRSLPLRLVLPGEDPSWPLGGVLAPAQRAQPGASLQLLATTTATTIVRIASASAPRRGVAAVTFDTAVSASFMDKTVLPGAQELLLRLDVFLDGVRVETWDQAALHPDHPDFLPRVIGRRALSEQLLAARVDESPEPDLAWGGEDDPPGSEYLRPALTLSDAVLTPTADLLGAAQGLLLDAATLPLADRGGDGDLTTQRRHFFDPTPGDAGDALTALDPFAGRPGALDTLSAWDDRNAASPVALVCMPDLLHPDVPETPPGDGVPADTCFGPCVQAAAPTAAPVLPYPGLELGSNDDFQSAQLRLVEHCEITGGRIALLDLPPGLTASDIVGWRRALASNRAALFAPWLRTAPVDDPLGQAISLPPSAAAAGLIARVERQIGVFASPGNQTVLQAFGLAQDPGLPDAGFLFSERIDQFRVTEKGLQLMGSRTTSLDEDWTHINVRRVVDWVMAQLALDLAWATFEPNNARLWAAMVRTAERRLQGLYDAGGLAGASAAQSYFARCDRSTMSQADLDEGRAIMLVGVAPAVPAEFLVFKLVRQGGDGASVEVAAA